MLGQKLLSSRKILGITKPEQGSGSIAEEAVCKCLTEAPYNVVPASCKERFGTSADIFTTRDRVNHVLLEHPTAKPPCPKPLFTKHRPSIDLKKHAGIGKHPCKRRSAEKAFDLLCVRKQNGVPTGAERHQRAV